MHHKNKSKKAKQATRELPEEDPEFQIAPMIDILLVLLVFFMSISSTQVLQTNDNVRLPVAKEGKEVGDNNTGLIIVNVLWSGINNTGSLEVSGKNYGVAQELAPMIKLEAQKSPETRVLIRADKDVKYDYLRSVLKAAAQGGVSNVTFSVVNRED